MNEKFTENLKSALNYIENQNLIPEIKEICNIFMYGENKKDTFLNFQIQLLNTIGPEYTPVLVHFFKSDILVPNSLNSDETFLQLQKIKKMINNKISQLDLSITNPFVLRNQLFSYNDAYPSHNTITLVRGDGQELSFHIDFNDGLALMNTLGQCLIDKFGRGSNNINRNNHTELIQTYTMLHQLIENLIHKEDEKINETN